MNYQTKEDQVANFLRENIISGHFPRGTRLKQADIAASLQMSITPVREAMKLLEAEGYVSCESHHGAIVSEFDASASDEVRDLRNLLEERLVRVAVPSLTADDLQQLERIQDEFERAVHSGDRIAVRGINYRFHLLLYQRAALPQTLHFVQILWARYPFDLVNSISGRTSRAVEEHRKLLLYLAAKDVESACLAIREHIQAGWAELRATMSQKSTAPGRKKERATPSSPRAHSAAAAKRDQ